MFRKGYAFALASALVLASMAGAIAAPGGGAAAGGAAAGGAAGRGLQRPGWRRRQRNSQLRYWRNGSGR